VTAVLIAVGLSQAAMGETILLDLGSDGTYRGASVTSLDVNGNTWNSVGYGYIPDLLDIDGNVTAVDYAPDGIGGTDYYNGPSGATQDPTASVYDAVALGNLGVDEAVYDYFANGAFQIQGLDPSLTYDLTIYGSHKFDEPGISTYTAYTTNDYLTAVASTTLANNQHVENGWAWEHNQDEVATLSVAPQANGIIYFGYEGYVNAIQIDAIPEPATIGLFGVFGAAMLVVRRNMRI
jgi:hypothetical protein